MRVHLPNSAFLGNIDPFLRSFEGSEPDILEVSANKSWISVHPIVLSFVAALGRNVGPSNIRCEDFEARSGHYLERMGLFRVLGIDLGMRIIEHESAGRFVPLTIIRTNDELTDLITEIIPLLHLEKDQAGPIKYTISELVRNVLEHSGSPLGAVVSAQYYKKSNSIRIGIADTGVGIQATISRSHHAPDHLEAIRLALNPGITGETTRVGGTELNAGAGLFFIKSIAKVNRDFFVIFSGDAMYKLLKVGSSTKRVRLYADPFDDRHSTEIGLSPFTGTAVGIDISLDTTEAFTGLLDQIRRTYVKTIKERKKARYRRPRFV